MIDKYADESAFGSGAAKSLARTRGERIEPYASGDVLASDAEREQAIVRLHDACGEGRLTLEEFSERVQLVIGARTRGQLAPITADLPARATRAVSRPTKSQRLTIAVMSEVKRRGRWRVEDGVTAISVMGSCTLDLRNAVTEGEEIWINTYVVMGQVKIIVPPGTPVEMEGFALMGTRDSKVDDQELLPRAATVRVRGLTIMGSVEVIAE